MGGIGDDSRSTHDRWSDSRWAGRRCNLFYFRCHVIFELLRSVFRWIVFVFVDGNVFVFVGVRGGPGDDGRREEREPGGDECEEVFEGPGNGLNGIDPVAGCIVGIIAIRADALVVHQRDATKDPILDQRIHNRSIDLPKELAGVLGALGKQDEAVVVQQVAVELVRRAGLPAMAGAGALERNSVENRKRLGRRILTADVMLMKCLESDSCVY